MVNAWIRQSYTCPDKMQPENLRLTATLNLGLCLFRWRKMPDKEGEVESEPRIMMKCCSIEIQHQ